MDFYHNYYKDMAKFQKVFSKNRDHAPSPPDHSTPLWSAEKKNKGSGGGDKAQGDVGVVGGGVRSAALAEQDVLSLESLDDVLKACEERLDHVRTECSK